MQTTAWFACAAATASASQTSALFPGPQYPVIHDLAIDVAVADFDGDGRLDAAAAETVGASLLFGDGAGGVRATVSLADQGQLTSIEALDVDGDGASDLVAAAYDLDAVLLLRNGGGAAFAGRQSFDVGRGPIDLCTLDLDGDGWIDLAVACRDDGTLELLRNDRNGGFAAPRVIDLSHAPVAIEEGDLDLDGFEDVVVALSGVAGLELVFSNGQGGVRERRRIVQPAGVVDVTLGDWNGDGRLDLATCSQATYEVHAFFNTGLAHFAAPVVLPATEIPQRARSHSLGTSDELVIATQRGTVLAWRCDAAGTFTLAGRTQVLDSLSAIYGFTLGDFDGDGRDDLVTANGESGSLSVLLARSPGAWRTASWIDADAPTTSADFGDLDGDSLLDLVVAQPDLGRVLVSRGDGQGGFTSPLAIPIGHHPNLVRIADLDRDGHADLTTVDWNASGVWVRLGLEQGGFGPPARYSTGLPLRTGVLDDLDGDGDLDWAVTSDAGACVDLLFGDGAGGFTVGPTTYWGGSGPNSIASGDLDHNGQVDLVVGSYGGSLAVLLGLGDGAFATPTLIDAGAPIDSVALGDLDGDGRLDVVVASSMLDRVAWRLGNGAGGFGGLRARSTSTGFQLGAGPAALALCDLDHDGDLDVVTANRDSGDVAVLLADGSGSLRPPKYFFAGAESTALAVADADGDGALDLAVTDAFGGDVALLFGQRPPTSYEYCVSGTSSQGCNARMQLTGTPSLGASSTCTLQVALLDGGRLGEIFLGVSGPLAVPWAAGSPSRLCVRPPLLRTGTQPTGGTAGACDGLLALELSELVAQNEPILGAPLAPGLRLWSQAWFRDPPAPRGTNLSNAVTFALVP